MYTNIQIYIYIYIYISFYGVPYYSILGQLLFSIFINYMILCSQKNKYILFADDTNIIIKYKLSNNLTIINNNQHVMTFFYGIKLINLSK